MAKYGVRSKAFFLACGVVAAGLTATAAAPALAQTVDELVVVGHRGVGDNVRSLSTGVSYRDLDLTTQDGRAILHERVRAAARDLCRQLNEDGVGSALTPSCERDAVDGARNQERLAAVEARPIYGMAPPPPAYLPPPAPAYSEDEAPAAAGYYGEPAAATVTTQTVTNNPVPDTPQNRAAYGGPMSDGGRSTTPAGN